MSYRELWRRDWRVLFQRVWHEVLLDDCFGASAQLAFYFLLAFFPFILFLAALATLLASTTPGELEVTTLQLLGEVMPQQALDLVDQTVGQTLRLLQEKNLRVLVLSIVLALWSASSGIRAVMVTLNRAWGVREGRPMWRRYGLSVLLTVAMSLGVIFAVPLLSLSSSIGTWIAERVGAAAAAGWQLGSRLVPVLALIVVVELVYQFAPNTRRTWPWITPGSILAVVLWLLATWGFSFYVARFGRYEVLYAGLGAPVVLLLWFYISGLAILVGGEMNAEIDRQAGSMPLMAVPAPPTTDAAGHDTRMRESSLETRRRPRERRRPTSLSRAGEAANPRPSRPRRRRRRGPAD
jgi:membrane protein